jgi:toxin ParE1/3/4
MKSNYRVLFSEEAYQDLKQAYNWYFDISNKLGARFMFFFEESISSISENPFQFQIKYKNVRSCFVSRFPFGIHYIIESQTVIVLGIFHMSLNPKRYI